MTAYACVGCAATETISPVCVPSTVAAHAPESARQTFIEPSALPVSSTFAPHHAADLTRFLCAAICRARLPLATSKTATLPSAPAVASALASDGSGATHRMPLHFVGWHGADDGFAAIFARSSGLASESATARDLRAFCSSLARAAIASTASAGTPPFARFASVASSASAVSAGASAPRFAGAPPAAPRALASAALASSRSLTVRAMTRHAASCW